MDNQFVGVPGASQEAFNTLNTAITNLIGHASVSGNTDSGGNRLVSTSTLKVISAVVDGYMAIPFHNNGNTYVKILNWSTMQPVASTAVTGTAYYLNN